MANQLEDRRATNQRLAPRAPIRSLRKGAYNLYPTSAVPEGTICRGFSALAEKLVGFRIVRIDGFGGVFWGDFQQQLAVALADRGLEPVWVDVSAAFKSEAEINALVECCLGGDDPLFGRRFEGELADFFDQEQFRSLKVTADADCVILFGCGAGMIEADGPLVYVDVPKNEVQFRSRAGAISNLGVQSPVNPKADYKRFFFVDWPVLNKHRAGITRRVDWFVDEQCREDPAVIAGDVLRDALDRVSRGVFRVRPWFEAGPWGGQWIKDRIPDLPQDVPNYAWSFELISPENGLMFDDGKYLIEVSFDWAMFHNSREILGEAAERFGNEFPIRFNFLDTFEGGNLSVQCHPRNEYIREHFGERFTQDETYYILDCTPRSEVYLGFVDDIDPDEFAAELNRSYVEGMEIDVRHYVNTEPTHKHDLFLIPGGTIHCSGVNNLVLEISATTYIFTFKMYDWLRMDLDGRPRPLNIDRALDNLYFERKGVRIAAEFVSRPRQIASGGDWRLVHLPTHRAQFYDVERFEFDSEVFGQTNGTAQVMAVVEGEGVVVETGGGMRQEFSYAETFVVPAAAESYKLINGGKGRAMVVKAFVKPGWEEPEDKSLR